MFLRGLNFGLQIANFRVVTGVCESLLFSCSRGQRGTGARLMGAAEAGRIMTGAPLMPRLVQPTTCLG